MPVGGDAAAGAGGKTGAGRIGAGGATATDHASACPLLPVCATLDFNTSSQVLSLHLTAPATVEWDAPHVPTLAVFAGNKLEFGAAASDPEDEFVERGR